MATEKPDFKFLPFFTSILITLGIGGVASYFTVPQIKTWYVYLHKPVFNPPNWLFGPVWTVLYIMIGIAAYIIWIRRGQTEKYRYARLIYFIQLAFNFCWSIVFFGMHQIFGALIIIILLWVSIVLNINAFIKISKAAGLLQIPYLLWVSFAGVLNLFIFILNR